MQGRKAALLITPLPSAPAPVAFNRAAGVGVEGVGVRVLALPVFSYEQEDNIIS